MGTNTFRREVVKTLRPPRVSRRTVPVNLRRDDLALFGHELERALPPAELLELRDVRVGPEGVLFKGWRMLPESFAFPANMAAWRAKSVVKLLARNYLLRRRRRLERRALWVVDDWSGGYFHWMADALTRLYAVRDLAGDLTLLLPHSYRPLGFVRPSLAPFGVRDVEFIGPGETFVCSELVVPTHTAPSGHFDEEIIRGVREVLVRAYGGTAAGEGGESVYISRAGAPKRRVANEAEVITVLRDFGFRVVRAEDHTFEEQVGIAARARHLASNHGAGLTNMLFMAAGRNVLELRHAADRVNNCYFTMASALGLNYFYQTCAPARPGEDPHTADIRVDTNALAQNLRLMLGG